MSDMICLKALDLLDREITIIDISGTVIFANEEARDLIGAKPGDTEAFGQFAGLWSEPAEEVRAVIRRLAGSSGWQPITLTRKSGRHAGLRIPMRGRAFLIEPNDPRSLYILVTSDRHRERSFEHHRRLIRHLNVQLAEGSRSEVLLTGLLESERRMRQELVHRVKNNLALLLSLMRLNRNRLDDPEIAGPLEDMERRILSIATVHDLLDRNQETDFVRADELIDRICAELETALVPGTVRIQRDLTPVRLHISDATPLALIINELITNALKHAFPQGIGTIRIRLGKNGGKTLKAVVQDDGVGATADTCESGQGTRILQALAQQIRGEIVRSVESGTTWQLTFTPREADEYPLSSRVH
ncbi:sensor histidine kinase [uncultured Jannaschia sp.]|uniref:sensor histidine kinase n=1 Tax=uncultured Jannaschia sp. TaxID=293347 RepID=UPI0026266C38|nr:sensor histidine kinase [uncultured Jannaschia sp.]